MVRRTYPILAFEFTNYQLPITLIMSIELHLEGPDANEETFLDLMDWLERANIEGLTKESLAESVPKSTKRSR
jgi:hypothetical protein